jgi:hypothetical protein
MIAVIVSLVIARTSTTTLPALTAMPVLKMIGVMKEYVSLVLRYAVMTVIPVLMIIVTNRDHAITKTTMLPALMVIPVLRAIGSP